MSSKLSQMGCDAANSLSLVENATRRCELWRSRQENRRRLLREITSLILNRRPSRPHTFWKLSIDEVAYRKRIVFPVISRLKPPVLSHRLKRKLRTLLSHSSHWHKFGTSQDGDQSKLTICSRNTRDLSEHVTGATLSSERPVEGDSSIKIYAGSATFLKGTQSANPHNDYCQHFVDTGERPQNFIRDTGLQNRFEEYPKLRELIRLKDELIHSRSTPPMYLRADLKTFDLSELQSKFDVVLIEPPLEEYHRMNGALFDQHWTWEEIERLEIERIVAPRSFVWIWCGSGEGLDAARRCLRKWGFRRCEDICWIKTNHGRPGHEALEPGAVFQRTKEHCLMGIHGTVRRSTDGDFIHANIDIDLIIEDSPKYGSFTAKDKPTEIFHIIEHFCLGRRRLHLFGRDSTLRSGWLTVGNELSASNFDARLYASNFTKEPNGWQLGTTDEIERMRPKSPPPRHPTVLSSSTVMGVPVVSKSQGAPDGGFSGISVLTPSSHSRNLLQLSTVSNSMNKGATEGSGPHSRRLGLGSPFKFHNIGALQPSLLGLPSPIPLDLHPGITRSSNIRDKSMHSLPNSISGIRNITEHLQVARPVDSLVPLSSGLLPHIWASPNTASLPINSPSSMLVSSALRASLSNTPLMSNLLAVGKLNPVMLAALNAAAAGSSFGLSCLTAPSRGLGSAASNPSKGHHFTWH